RQVLGETWAGHYGANHRMSTRLSIVPEAAKHPILRGVKDAWVQAGGYWTNPMPNSQPLLMAQPLNGMKQESPVAENKKPCPGAWTRTYQSKSGKSGRVFTTTYGASEDILNDGFRRTLMNACFWAIGLEEKITPELNAKMVGPYHPVTFSFKGNRQNVKPLDLSGWDSPIMPPGNPVGVKNAWKKPPARKAG
ncbi:MAG: ThuA domain-containing protein, partial [Planctomycetota bacterium]